LHTDELRPGDKYEYKKCRTVYGFSSLMEIRGTEVAVYKLTVIFDVSYMDPELHTFYMNLRVTLIKWEPQ
jgi:hypothetical protein